MPDFLIAGGAAFLSGSMLLVGALVSWFVKVPPSVTAGIMAFGSGVLLSTLAYELVQEASDSGGVAATIAGCLSGAILYVIADSILAHYGAQHRKRSTSLQNSEEEKQGSGTAIAIGALFDGIPESLVLGLSVVATGGVSMALLRVTLPQWWSHSRSQTPVRQQSRSLQQLPQGQYSRCCRTP
jgi:ZIP family zinc transporter